ncbi:MAG: 2,3-dimethylmalate dehydratase small subunit [Calditrichaeota bacterium]|nr:2,3-dimethylmalate dehydratase small subunit [Calditrichota bacterium]
METTVRGRVWKYGDDVNTDVIFPGKYTYTISDPEEMGEHALEDLDPEFAGNVRPGDVIIAGKNFGCGSSREQAAVCLKVKGVGAIIAPSFSRIYFRNGVNNGIPLITSKEAPELFEHGDEIEIDFEHGVIRGERGQLQFPPFNEFVFGIMDAGGLIPYTRRRLIREGKLRERDGGGTGAT